MDVQPARVWPGHVPWVRYPCGAHTVPTDAACSHAGAGCCHHGGLRRSLGGQSQHVHGLLKYIFVAEKRVNHSFHETVYICTCLNNLTPGKNPVIHRKLYVFAFPVTAVNSSLFVMNIR